MDNRIEDASNMIAEWAGIDGGHHKQWLIDQVIRILQDGEYPKWVEKWEDGEDGPKTYRWDTGIAP